MDYILRVNPFKQRAKQALSSPTVRTISGLAGGNLFATIIALVGSLVQAHFVSPDDLGFLRSFSIVTSYLFFFNLGIFDAIHRLYPYYIGKGQNDRALAVAEVAQAWSVIFSGITTCAFVVLAIIAMVSGNWRATLGWLVQAVTIIGSIYGGYLAATYRSGHDFLSVAKGTVISSVVSLLVLPFFIFWSYIALIMRSSLGNLANLIYLHFHRPLQLRLRFSWKEFFALIKQGMPLFIAGYVSTTFWSAVQSTIVLKYLGTQALGFWGLSIMLFESANKIPQALVSVYTPRVTQLFGKTGSVDDCISLIIKPMVWGITGSILLAAVGWVALPFVVPIIMPKYINAIPTMSLLLLMMPLLVLELPIAVLVAMNKRTQLNIAVFSSLGVFVLLSLIAVRTGFGLNGIAIASLLGTIVMVLFIFGFVYKGRNSES
jgi:O-antigen/teichoic acid export membrane protein